MHDIINNSNKKSELEILFDECDWEHKYKDPKLPDPSNFEFFWYNLPDDIRKAKLTMKTIKEFNHVKGIQRALHLTKDCLGQILIITDNLKIKRN